CSTCRRGQGRGKVFGGGSMRQQGLGAGGEKGEAAGVGVRGEQAQLRAGAGGLRGGGERGQVFGGRGQTGEFDRQRHVEGGIGGGGAEAASVGGEGGGFGEAALEAQRADERGLGAEHVGEALLGLKLGERGAQVGLGLGRGALIEGEIGQGQGAFGGGAAVVEL